MAKAAISSLTSLSAKQKKQILESLEEYYGDETLKERLKDHYFYINSTRRIHISTLNVDKLNVDRVNSIGIYFAAEHDGERYRISGEGSRLITPKKNYIVLKDEALQNYLSGENLFEEELAEIHDEGAPFLIIMHKDKALGSVARRGNEFISYLAKGKRLDFNKLF